MSDKIPGNILQKMAGIDLDLAKKILDTIPAGISIATDASCKEIIHNAKAAEFLRIKPWESLSLTLSLGQTVKAIHNGKELSPAEMPIQRATWNGEEVKDFEIDLVWDDGVRKTTVWNSIPLFDDGSIIGAIASFEDITKRKQAEEMLQESEEKYRTLFNLLDEGFCIIDVIFDLQGRPVDWLYLETNPAFVKQGGSPDTAGRLASELYPETEKHWFEFYGRVALTGVPDRIENESKVLNGWLEISAFKMGDQDSRKVAVLYKNITGRKRAEEALRASEARQSFLLRLNDALRPLADAQAIQDTATGLLTEHLRATQASYDEYTEDAIVVHSETLGDAGQPLAVAGTHRKSDFPAYVALLHTGKDVVVPDMLSVPEYAQEERAHLAALNIRASISVPLVKEGRLAAALNVRQATPRQWTAAEVELVRETAERTWAAVERARAEAELGKTLDYLEEKVAERTRELAQERQRLFDVLETLPANIFLLTPDYRVSFANRAFREAFGESNGRCCYDYIQGLHEPCEFCQSLRVLETGEPCHWEVKIPDGRIIDVYDFPFTDVDGSHLILEMSFDVTERENAARALRQSEERFSKIFYNSPNSKAIIRVKDNRYIDVNQKFLDLIEYSREEVLGKTPEDLSLWAESSDYTESLLGELKGKGQVSGFEYRIRTGSGKMVTVWSSAVMMDLNGELCRITFMKDITNEKKLEAEITRLDRLNLVGEMAAGIGHEVRNPMTTVRGFLQLLGRKEMYAQDREYFELMVDELDRANSIISEFLSLAKNKAVNLEMKDLNKILESILPLIQADGLVTDKYIDLKTKKIPELLLDGKEIRQLVLNLVSNGLQAMEPGGTLTLETFMTEDNVVLAVQDQGSGIPAEIIDKIGMPFFTTKDHGTGLGLSVCYSIAARHGAVIDVETGPAGTTFLVRFKKPD